MTDLTPTDDGLTHSTRGYRHCDPITVKRGEIRLFDSSAYDQPRITLRVEEIVVNHPPVHGVTAHAHMTITEAGTLRDQLTRLIEGDL